jgi:superfamily II DNA or RNA helicase
MFHLEEHVPSFQQALAKLANPLPVPSIWELEPESLLPLLPVGIVPEGRVPTIYSLETEFNTYGNYISPDWLALLLEEAQPKITRPPSTFGFDSAGLAIPPQIYQNNSFPLPKTTLFDLPKVQTTIIANVSDDLTWIIDIEEPSTPEILLSKFDIEEPSTSEILISKFDTEKFSISENLSSKLCTAGSYTPSNNMFQHLRLSIILWHNYQEKKWHTEKPTDIQIDDLPQKHPHGKKFVNGVEVNPHSTPKVKLPSFWDLIYPLLHPPLILEETDNLFLPHHLLAYQPVGIAFLMNNESALLADDMGTGKTVMTTVALKILFQQHRIRRALIVCPVSVVREWRKHLDEWASELVSSYIPGTRDIRSIRWNTDAHIYVTTYDSLRGDIESRLLPYNKLGVFDVVILDEAQNIKNPISGRSKAIKKLTRHRRWALTGTPIENKIEDLASLFDFLRPGFLSPYDMYPERIREKIKPYFLRRRKIDVLPDLPPKIKQKLWLEMDDSQRKEYERVSLGIIDELTGMGDQVTKVAIFGRIQRLKQICNFASNSMASPKTELLLEQVEQIIQSGQKVIIFSQYVKEGIEKLEQILAPFGFAKIVGDQSQSVRDREIDRFKKMSEVSILLASVKAGGVGLNLTEASYVIHFDHWWNPATMWQAEDRVHRRGQKADKVNVYSYWMAGTIEEKIHNILEEKGLLFADVIDGLAESQIDELISTNEWLEMLGVKVKNKVTLPTTSKNHAHLSLEEIRQQLLDISPSQFEHVVKELVRCLGYPNPKVTGRTGDGGIDILASRNINDGVIRIAAQCNRYRGTVSASTARDFRGAITTDNTIKKGFLVTTSDFSNECKSFCEQSGIIVPISGLELARYVKDFGISIE